MRVLAPVKNFFKRFDPVEASDRAAMDYIVAGGYFGTQLAGIPENEEDIVQQSAQFSKALIPFLGTKHDSWMHELLDRFLQNYEYYLYLKEIRERISEKNKNKSKDKKEEKNKDTLQDKKITINHTIECIKDSLVSEGKIILSLTYQKIENKTIVLNKPYLIDSGRGSIIPTRTKFPGVDNE